MTVDGGDRPKKGYATKIRSSIRAKILEEYTVNVSNPDLFPGFAKMWKGRGSPRYNSEDLQALVECQIGS